MNGKGHLNREAHREAATTMPTPKAMLLSAYLFYRGFCMIQYLFAISYLLTVSIYIPKHDSSKPFNTTV